MSAAAVGPALPFSGEARAAMREAACLRLVGLLFERPRPGWHEAIADLAAEVGDTRLDEAVSLARAAGEGEYQRIFGNGGQVSPREAAYGRFTDPGRVLADLAGLYQAFGYRPRAEDPADHVAVEVGFAAYLALKEAYGLATGDAEAAVHVRRARTLFFNTHLRPLAAALRGRLADVSVSQVSVAPHLAAAAEVLATRTGCDTAHPSSSPTDGSMNATVVPSACSIASQGGPFACDGCDGDLT